MSCLYQNNSFFTPIFLLSFHSLFCGRWTDQPEWPSYVSYLTTKYVGSFLHFLFSLIHSLVVKIQLECTEWKEYKCNRDKSKEATYLKSHWDFVPPPLVRVFTCHFTINETPTTHVITFLLTWLYLTKIYNNIQYW